MGPLGRLEERKEEEILERMLNGKPEDGTLLTPLWERFLGPEIWDRILPARSELSARRNLERDTGS